MPPRIAVTGSIAFDVIMVFAGRFGEHILPDLTHQISVSFFIDRFERRHGGTAANIAYTLALLGERPLLAGAVGEDFAAYADLLSAAGVDVAATLRCAGLATASAYIITDLDNNQIAAFHPGAAVRAAEIDAGGLADVDVIVVSPDDPEAMRVHVEQAAATARRLVFAPAQQLPALPDQTLADGIAGAWLLVGNDYELELVRTRTGMSPSDIARRGTIVAQTLGARGSRLFLGDDVVEIPAAPVAAVVDPTGAGDAYVAGLLAGLRAGADPAVAGRMASLAAAYVVERTGTQVHAFDSADFADRYRSAFGGEYPPPSAWTADSPSPTPSARGSRGTMRPQ